MSGGQDTNSKNSHIEVPGNPVNTGHNTAALVFNGINAVGALILAILAIFGDRIRAWLAKPVINVDCGRDIPFIEEIKVQSSNTSDSETVKTVQIRLRILNTGRSSAKQCRVLVHEFYVKRSDGSKYIKKPILPRHIHWPTEEPQDLIPTVPYYLTIAEIRDDEQMGSSGGDGAVRIINSKLFIRIESSGAKGSFHEIGKGTVVLPIRVFAENVRGNEVVYIEVFWNGKMISDRAQESFGCRRLSSSEVQAVVGGAQ